MTLQEKNQIRQVDLKVVETDEARTDTAPADETPASREAHQEVSPPNLGPRYDILECVGSGGMGTVWKVYDKELKETFAIKVLKPELLADDVALKRFQKEASLASDLTHANIAAIFGPGEDTEGRPYIIMRYVEGESLADILKREGKLDPERAMDIFWQIHAALSHSHMKGIVHRDIKPSNIIISRTESGGDRVNVIDFGIAKSVYEEFSKTQALTKAIDVFGSPQYMSPEQLLGKEVGPESDFYSLGCVLYEMFTGTPPFVSENPVELLVRQLNEAPDLKKIPGNYSVVVAPFLEKAPEIRRLLRKANDSVDFEFPSTFMELTPHLKYIAAVLPILLISLTFTNKAGLNDEVATTVAILCASLYPLIIGLLTDAQTCASKAMKETSASSLIGLLFAYAAFILNDLVPPQLTAHFPSFTPFAITVICATAAIVTTSKVDLVSVLKTWSNFLNPINEWLTFSRMANKIGLFLITAINVFSTIVISPLLLLGLLISNVQQLPFLLSITAMLSFNLTLLTYRTNRRAGKTDSKGKTHSLASLFIWQIAKMTATALFFFAVFIASVPQDYITALLARREYIIANNTQRQAEHYKSAAYLPKTASGDFARLVIINYAPVKIANRKTDQQVVKQIISNESYQYPNLKADAYLRAAQISDSHKEKQLFVQKSLEYLKQPKAMPLADFRDEFILNWLVSPSEITKQLAKISIELRDEKLAQSVQDFATKIPDSKKTKEQIELFKTFKSQIESDIKNKAPFNTPPLRP